MAIINIEVTDTDIIFNVTKGDQLVFTRTGGTASKIRVMNGTTAVLDQGYATSGAPTVKWETWTIADSHRDVVLGLDDGAARKGRGARSGGPGPLTTLKGKIRVKP